MCRGLVGRYAKGVCLVVLATVLNARSGYGGNVIILVIDGARYSETFGGDSLNIPHIWTELRPQGTIWTNFRNEGVTLTAPGHASMATGTLQDIPNDGSQRPTLPTLCEYLRKGSGCPESDAVIIADKSKLAILTYSTHPDYGPTYGGSFICAGEDLSVYDSLTTVMDSKRPRFITVNLADVDHAGHSGDWVSYVAAIKRADSLVCDLWRRIQVSPFYRDSTTLFVTDDHGRHDDANGGFQEHGDGCEGCRHILLVAIGKQIPRGLVVPTLRTQCDIAPTVGKLLGVPTPFTNGVSLFDDMVRTSAPGSRRLQHPGSAQLEQNFPNPFNGIANIRFRLPAGQAGIVDRAWVTMKVYDLLGREVALLVNEWKEPGVYQVDFDATGLAAGVYLCRLSGETSMQTRRMVLLR